MKKPRQRPASRRGSLASIRNNVSASLTAKGALTVWKPPELTEPPPMLAKPDGNLIVWTPPDVAAKPLPVLVPEVRSNIRPWPIWEPPAPVERPAMRPRLVFAVDATASRSAAWDAAQRLTEVVLKTLPGKLDVALAVHRGHKLKTFTEFTSDAGELAREAAKVECEAGETRLLEILARVLKEDGVGVVVYIGDMFEESPREARRLADALRRRGTQVIVLHDTSLEDNREARTVFEMLAKRTGGTVLPFRLSALENLVELVQAVAVLAVEGTQGLKANQKTMPGAPLLLEHLKRRD
jgi:hypothetical protein